MSNQNKILAKWKQFGEDASDIQILDKDEVEETKKDYYCRICKTSHFFSASYMEKHVYGEKHQTNAFRKYWEKTCKFGPKDLVIRKNEWECKLCKTKNLVSDVAFFKNHCKLHQHNFIPKLWQSLGCCEDSLSVVDEKSLAYCCNTCDKNMKIYAENDIVEHITSANHKQALIKYRQKSFANLEDKFEISLDTFVCKCCNVSFDAWQEQLIADHLDSVEHGKNFDSIPASTVFYKKKFVKKSMSSDDSSNKNEDLKTEFAAKVQKRTKELLDQKIESEDKLKDEFMKKVEKRTREMLEKEIEKRAEERTNKILKTLLFYSVPKIQPSVIVVLKARAIQSPLHALDGNVSTDPCIPPAKLIIHSLGIQ